MESELRVVLMILGVMALLALVVHGIYTVRQNKKAQQAVIDENETNEVGKDESSLDDGVVSEPRVVATSRVNSESTSKSKTKLKKKPAGEKERVEPAFDSQSVNTVDVDDDESIPVQEGLSFNASVEDEELANKAEPKKNESVAAQKPEEVIILNVVAVEGKSIHGARLLPILLELGFKFGDFDIFHRHVEEKGEGSVLFSLANMYNPGTFDLDNMEQFTTQGVSLFMSLPVDADAMATFKKMHEAAKTIAAEFSGQVLDGQRSVLTRQTVQHYYGQIREFERRRLIQ